MTSLAEHDANRAAMLREREARKEAYLSAIEERDGLAAMAAAADATLYDRTALRRAESRVDVRLAAMQRWSDPIPGIKASPAITAPGALTLPPLERAGAVSPMSEADTLVAQIIAAAEGATLPAARNAADRLADEIVAAAELASVDDMDALADEIVAAAEAAA